MRHSDRDQHEEYARQKNLESYEIEQKQKEKKSLKSAIVQNLNIDNKDNYSELQILRSSAGFYIGTIYTDPETGFEEPGSRDSGYFKSREEAEKFLKSLHENEDAQHLLRSHP